MPESSQAAGWASAGMYFQRLTGGFSGATKSVGCSIDNFLPTTRKSGGASPKNQISEMAKFYIAGENADKTFGTIQVMKMKK